MYGWGTQMKRISLIILLIAFFALSVMPAFADPCGGHGQPSCNGVCNQGLQECDYNGGTCYHCCGDGSSNDICGTWTDDVTSCDGNVNSERYDIDCDPCGSYENPWCGDPEFDCNSWLFPSEEDSYKDPAPSNTKICCNEASDCAYSHGSSENCIAEGTDVLLYTSESSICDNGQLLACTGYHVPGPRDETVGTVLHGMCCQGPYDNYWTSANEWTANPATEDTWSLQDSCADGGDNDCDGLIDCDDPDCAGVNGCPGNQECTDADNDGWYAEPACLGLTDCDDTDPNVNPGEDEICDNGIDDDCDGDIDGDDSECQQTCTDYDGDGYYREAACPGQTDCNDYNPLIYPGANELCNGIDDDCDGQVDEGFLDDSCITVCTDNGHVWVGNGGQLNCCGDDAGAPAYEDSPYEQTETLCDGRDNDCNGLIDEHPSCGGNCIDADGDGFNVTGGACGPIDCDDNNASIYPGATEICNSIDDDCNGLIDDGLAPEDCPGSCTTLGYTWTGNGGQLNCCGNDPLEDDPFETNETLCDGHDNDCDGLIDEPLYCDGNQTCTDTDGGINYPVYGVVTVTSSLATTLFQDECLDAITLTEYYCVGSDAANITATCAGTCVDGECVNDSCVPYNALFDYNFDGLMNSQDVNMLANFIANDINCPLGTTCDVNNDGDQNMDDLTRLNALIAGATDGENCFDDIDNDCDGLIDDEDPDCEECDSDDDCVIEDCPAYNGTYYGMCQDGYCVYNITYDDCFTECSDNDDNDGDGYVDFDGGLFGELMDPGCTSLLDDDEYNECYDDGDCESICPDGTQAQAWPWFGICDGNYECQYNLSDCDECHPYYFIYDYDENQRLDIVGDWGFLFEVVFNGASCQGHVCDVNNDLLVNGDDLNRLQDIINGVYDNGEVCDDGFDNNCDGLTDDEDPNCGNTCGDTDGGVNYEVRGTVTIYTVDPFPPSSIHVDYCRNDGITLHEFYCLGSELGEVEVRCAGGCVDGRCIPVDDPICGEGIIHLDNENTPGLGLLYSVNEATGVSSYLKDYSSALQAALAIDSQGRVYSITTSGGESHLVRLNDDGSETIVGPLGVSGDPIPALAFVDSTLYGFSSSLGRLYSINTATGDATVLHTFTNFTAAGGDFAPTENGDLVYVNFGGAVSLIDLPSYTVTALGNLPGGEGFSSLALFANTYYALGTVNENLYRFTIAPFSSSLVASTAGPFGMGDAATCDVLANSCGNGRIDVGETCDGNPGDSNWDWGRITNCTTFDSYTGGSLSCGSDCHFNTSQCTGGNDSGICGDGIIQQGETCDGSNWGLIQSCRNFDNFTGGGLDCYAPGEPSECRFDTRDCEQTPLNCTDADGDGYNLSSSDDCGPIDCDDSNPNVNPGAAEICDNGIDDDCDGLIDENDPDCQGPVCGNSVIELGETCDGLNWGPISNCTSFDNFTGGALSCDPVSCLFNTSMCTGGNETGVCGDGVINTGETCDFINATPIYAGLTCTNFDSFTGGTLSCDTNTCQINTSQCELPPGPYCGDGIIQPGEECEAADWGPITNCTSFDNFTGGNLTCDLNTCLFDTSQCEMPDPFCGDGIIQPGEECDGTNWGPITNCTAFDSYTGGNLTCDPVSCLFDVDECTGNNNTGICGDGIIDAGEQCDGNPGDATWDWGPINNCTNFDNFITGSLACAPSCVFDTSNCEMPEPFCGDGIIQSGEQCDGTNWGVITNCSAFDDFIGGSLNCDPVSCLFDTNQCFANNSCGNGVRETGEQCDGSDFGGLSCSNYGNFNQGSLSCTASCTISTSGCSRSGGGGGGGGSRGGGGGGSVGCREGFHLENGVCVEDSEEEQREVICDADGDNYVKFRAECTGQGRGVDCDDHDKDVYPGAPELCGDGKDNDCDGEIDEDCEITDILSYNSQVSVPLLSIIEYDVRVGNYESYELEDLELRLELPSNWRYDGAKRIGDLKPGEAKRASFRLLVTEDLDPTQEIGIVLEGASGVIATGKTMAKVVIPSFAVRVKPSLDNYQREDQAEVYVIVSNKKGGPLTELEVELNVNQETKTDYVQYLGVFGIKPYSTFRYRYTYPVSHLREGGVIVEGSLRKEGKLLATSDDTLATVYHPTPFDKDARTWEGVRTYN
jgi:hypothetical protein